MHERKGRPRKLSESNRSRITFEHLRHGVPTIVLARYWEVTTELAHTADTIKIEDLNIQNMTRSASGTVDEPGTNVAQKRGLNRSILQQGWGLFEQRLEHKIGDRLVKVPAAYTSQRCNPCGHTAKENRENQAGFRCRSCGHTANADVNAARNIADGQAATTCRDTAPPLVDVGSMKQEPPQYALTA